ncbi:MAG TPA: STAS domain-containing protein [Solirubrobacteraceae bacterium]|jgi:anti-anti-sigma factor|nr:STAS domain-containing protein [Solirubrobacteraceae bacterium]
MNASRKTRGLLSIETRTDRQRAVLRLAGDADMASASLLREEVERLQRAGAAHVIIDLRELRFIDSAGIHVLVAGHRPCAGARLSIVLGRPAVRRALELCGVLEHIEVLDPAALAALADDDTDSDPRPEPVG